MNEQFSPFNLSIKSVVISLRHECSPIPPFPSIHRLTALQDLKKTLRWHQQILRTKSQHYLLRSQTVSISSTLISAAAAY